MTTESRWTDHEVDQVIGRLLQLGVLIATVVVVIGVVLLLAHDGGAPVSYTEASHAPSALHTVGGTFALALAGNAAAIVQLGLILLIATPVARVALTLGAFIIQRDRVYVLLTTIVLGVLLFGLFA